MWGRILLLTISLSAGSVLWAAEAKTDIGTINGAEYRIDIPENWNGVLLVYCHGYSPAPGKFGNAAPNPVLAALLKDGYAAAQSGYQPVDNVVFWRRGD
jgi:hypothetical protein